jgi:hypothetical protein
LPVPSWRVTPAGTIDTFARIPGRDEVMYREAASFGSRSVLFGRDAHHAVRGDVFVDGESGTFQMAIYHFDGTLRRIVRVAAAPRPVTDAERTAAEEQERERRREGARQLSQQMGRPIEEDRSEIFARDTHPFFDAIMLERTGHLWLRQPAIDPDAQRTWQVFDRDGRWLGSAATPPGLQVTEIGDDYILGIHPDEYDVEYVHIHRLVR